MTIQDGLELNKALEYAKGNINLALKLFNNNRYEEVKEFQLLEQVGILLGTVYLTSDDIRFIVQSS